MPNLPFNAATTRWQAANALGSAMASKLAYQDAGAIDATVKAWGFDRSTFFQSQATDTYGFVASKVDMVLVAFRGTDPEDLKNWITDADAIMADTELGSVHYGFWAALDSVWDQVNAAIADHQKPGRSLWFTGHSLGA